MTCLGAALGYGAMPAGFNNFGIIVGKQPAQQIKGDIPFVYVPWY